MRYLVHVWLMMATIWFALSIQWEADGEHLHAAITFFVGCLCYLFSERVRGRQPYERMG